MFNYTRIIKSVYNIWISAFTYFAHSNAISIVDIAVSDSGYCPTIYISYIDCFRGLAHTGITLWNLTASR